MNGFEEEFKQEVKEHMATEYISNMIELGYPDEEIAQCLMVSVEKVAAVRSGVTA